MSAEDPLIAALRAGQDSLELPDPAPAPAPAFLRLAATLSAPTERLAPFAARLSALMDVGQDTARSYLARIFDPSAWQPLMPDVDAVHLEGGPATAGSDVGFVRIAPGGVFPDHEHLGDERVLVLQGRVLDSSGEESGPGDATHLGPGSAHGLRCVSKEPLVYAVVVGGIRMADGSVIDVET